MPPPRSRAAITQTELVALLAMLMATVAFSIDAMLPALSDIAASLSPEAPNRAQLVVSTFIVGMGVGTLVAGPLSDAYGRRSLAVAGAAIFIAGAFLATVAQSIELLLVARALQGLGASGPRVVAIAIIRDLFEGRQMARITSLVITVFTLVPILAPSLGAGIAWAFGWRAIFFSFAVFSVTSILWLLFRLDETLPPQRRRPFRTRELVDGLREIARNGQVVTAIAVQTLIFTTLFIALMTSQPVFDQYFGRASSFPVWFGVIAAVSATASLLNAAIVVRLGMRWVVARGLAALLVISALHFLTLTVLPLPGEAGFAAFLIWQTAVFYMAGLGLGNMNAIALEPLGHMAGLAASIVTAAATILSMSIAVPVGLAFDGTPLPGTAGILAASLVALLLMSRIRDTEAAPVA